MAERFSNRMRRRQFLLAAAGFTGTAMLVGCSSNNNNSSSNKPVVTATTGAAPVLSPTTAATRAPAASVAAATAPAASVAAATAAASATLAAADLNAQGWPKSINPLRVGQIPSDANPEVDKGHAKPFTDFISTGIGVPVQYNITTSYGALVEAQKNKQIELGYYGPLSFLLAEQQFGAVPLVVDAPDGKTPGNYHSILIAGKNSPVKTVADIKGKDFTFVDPASTSGYLFPIAMLKAANIDPAKDIKARFAGSHGNSILAVAKGQVPCGATNDGNLAQAITEGSVAKDDIVVLQTSPDIPNGPYAVRPDLDPRAVALLLKTMTGFTDAAVLKSLGLQGPLVAVQTSLFDYVRQTGKLIGLQFDTKGNSLIPNAPTPVPTGTP